MEIQGKITSIGEVRQVSDKFKTRDVIVEYSDSNPEFANPIKFELVQDKVDIIDPYKVGDTVGVHFNLRGRAFTGKDGKTTYFNSLVIWRLTAGEGQPEMAAAGVGEDDGSEPLPF